MREKGASKGRGRARKVLAVLAVLHPLEAAVAARMAASKGRRPAAWALATLAFGVLALFRLKKLPSLESPS